MKSEIVPRPPVRAHHAGLRKSLQQSPTVCVLPGTNTELAVGDYFHQAGMSFKPVLIDSTNELRSTLLSGRCDGYATDTSALAGLRASLGDKARQYVLLPELISKEPMAPAVRKGDEKWFDLVHWTQLAMLTVEELGITSANVDGLRASTNPDVRRLLGLEGNLGAALGVSNDWAYAVIKQVGNTVGVWDRNIAPLGIPRGRNAPWGSGDLRYAPSVR